MSRNTLLMFSHLLGRAPKAKAGKLRADEEDDKQDRRDKEDEQDENRREEDDDDKERRRREEDEEDEGEQGEDDEEEDEDDRRDKKDTKASAARRRERARCAAIFKSSAAAARPDFAAHLAFETSMGRKAACRMLKAAATNEPKRKSGLFDRMRGMEDARPGQDGSASPSGARAVASSWDAAGKRIGAGRR